MKLINDFKKHLTTPELQTLAKRLHDSYEPLMPEYSVWKVIDNISPSNVSHLFEALKPDHVGHEVINGFVMKYYQCEKVVKFHLVKKFLRKKRDVTIFEMNIDNSRLDIGRINGCSYAYEIKTNFDNLSKLQKQIIDYSKVLEYINVVTHEKHLDKVKNIVPGHCGILLYRFEKDKFSVEEIKSSSLSPFINTENQIKNLASKDIEFVLKKIGIKNLPTIRQNREKLLLKELSNIDFNELFKLALKHKFSNRWEYLKSNFNQIQPIDVQAFFSMQADPYWVYYRNSSMV